MIRRIKTSGGPIKCTYEEFVKMAEKIRDLLINNGFGLCSRGPITYDWLTVLYGRKNTAKYWKQRNNEILNR